MNEECYILNWNVILPCPDCHKFVNANLVKLNYLSFKYIADLDKPQKNVAVPGIVTYDTAATLNLGATIASYVNSQTEESKFPLKNLRSLKHKYGDKLQMLGFAYASIFGSFMGNSHHGKSPRSKIYVKFRKMGYY